MRFSITADYREFFSKNNFIEFEEVLPLDQVALIKKSAEEIVAKRLHTLPTRLSLRPASEIFQAGYDVWRDSEAIKKTTHKSALATIASELLQTVPIRYGFDQYFSITQTSNAPFAQDFSLQESSCLNPLAGALLLPLDDLLEPLSFFPLPIKAGSGLFISPQFPIPWTKLFATKGLRFLIAFAAEKTMFRPDSRDPHAVNLKKLGYVFNEWLKDSVHPIVLRKNP